jgi:hypothetical protein
MRLNDTTPEQWDALRKTGLEAWMQAAHEEAEQIIDNVNNPSHYNTGGIECIEAIEQSMTEEAFKGYLKGNVQKYMWRYESKAKPAEDLKKACWYLNKLLEVQEAEDEYE